MEGIVAARILTFSGSLSILFSVLVGFAMLIPLQPWGRKWVAGINFKQIVAAHLDWIMLGLMQGLAAMLIMLFALQPAAWTVWAMVAGGWINPLSYMFRAFGVDAFALSGGLLQRTAALLGGASSIAIFVAWCALLPAAAAKFG